MGDKRNITAVYIRGCAFKCTQGGRRHMVLLNLKKADEKRDDLWLLKAIGLVVVGMCIGSVAAYLGVQP